MLQIHISTRFKRSFKRMPFDIRQDFAEKIALFKQEPFHIRLGTHKLGGRLGDYYAFCLRDGYRVLFDFASHNVVLLVNVGSHDEYKKWGRTK